MLFSIHGVTQQTLSAYIARSCENGLALLRSLRSRVHWQLICCGDETFVDGGTANALLLPLIGCWHLRLSYFSTRGASGQKRVLQFRV